MQLLQRMEKTGECQGKREEERGGMAVFRGTRGQNGNALGKKKWNKKGTERKGRVILALKVGGVNMR